MLDSISYCCTSIPLFYFNFSYFLEVLDTKRQCILQISLLSWHMVRYSLLFDILSRVLKVSLLTFFQGISLFTAFNKVQLMVMNCNVSQLWMLALLISAYCSLFCTPILTSKALMGTLLPNVRFTNLLYSSYEPSKTFLKSKIFFLCVVYCFICSVKNMCDSMSTIINKWSKLSI